MAEPIERPFGLWTRLGPWNHVLDESPDTHGKGQFLRGGEEAAHCKSIDNASMCAAMRPSVKLLLPLVMVALCNRADHYIFAL